MKTFIKNAAVALKEATRPVWRPVVWAVTGEWMGGSHSAEWAALLAEADKK